MNLDAWVRPNSQDVAAKVLDGEAIMINLAMGTYYSLNESGTVVWELIERGQSLKRIVEVVAEQFGVSREVVGCDIQILIQTMLDERVVMQIEEPVQQEEAFLPGRSETDTKAYQAPELQIYRDMADLLALEPPTPGSAQEDLWEGG